MALNQYEVDYLHTLSEILAFGTEKEGRNGKYRSLPFQDITFGCLPFGKLPLLTTRKVYTQGILGEYAAIIRGPKHVDDFKKWGCNYWDTWADEDGNLKVDYGNAWRDYNGYNQMDHVIRSLRDNPGDRRMVIDAWRPDQLASLSLPCCHYSYQFWTDGYELSLLWNQRSADWCVGVPSDMVLAATMLLSFASVAGLKPGLVKMVFGDAHVYAEHYEKAEEQLKRPILLPPSYVFAHQEDVYSFEPDHLHIYNYNHGDPIKYELKG